MDLKKDHGTCWWFVDAHFTTSHEKKKPKEKKLPKKEIFFLGLSYFPKKVLLSNVHYSINILHCLIVPLLPNTAVM